MHTNVTELFEHIWQDYLTVTPSAAKVHALLGSSQQQDVVNDHVAYRTFNAAAVNLEKLAAHLLALGYTECGEYHFEAKKLYAKHFEHPDPTQPKVFVSELLLELCSPELQTIVQGLLAQMPADAASAKNFLYSGRHWQLDHATYQALLAESEYAAWLAAWGYKANHFTVSVNHLTNFSTLQQVNERMKAAGFALNMVGGEIKGSPEVMLEQSSTLADQAEVQFSDGARLIPSCFYEFALRYNKTDGAQYSGFVAESADKIFESTNAR